MVMGTSCWCYCMCEIVYVIPNLLELRLSFGEFNKRTLLRHFSMRTGVFLATLYGEIFKVMEDGK